jgi:hypothetical protein
METNKGVSWSKPRYDLELTAEDLEKIGRKRNERDVAVNYDLAPWVQSGEIEVS